MKTSFAFAIALSALSTPVIAQDAASPAATTAATPQIKRGTIISMTDGRRVGRVDRIRNSSVGTIYNGRYVLIPASTLSPSEHGLVTSLTRTELSAL